VHRIAVSRRYSDSLHTILNHWDLQMLLDANAILDSLEDAEEEHNG
jgi:hypothetical protein